MSQTRKRCASTKTGSGVKAKKKKCLPLAEESQSGEASDTCDTKTDTRPCELLDPECTKTGRGNPVYRWCFTLNNWTEEEYGTICSSLEGRVKYLIIGKEVGEKGTPHLQGFVNLTKKVRRSTLKQLLKCTRVHVEPARGTDLENQRYCQKQKDYLEVGKPQCQGKSSALQEALRMLQTSNGDLGKVAASFPEVYVRHGRGMRDYVNVSGLVPRREKKTTAIVLVGPPGVGKTKYVMQQIGEDTSYWKPRGPWWDGYQQQTCVVLDDFYGWVCFDELLRVLDRYPLKVPIKGGFVEFNSDIVYITSNKEPQEWYNEENICGTMEALFRRFNKVYELVEGGVREMKTVYEINY
ncbi:Rep [Bat associated circovirus 6]|uniref:Replication-associated protein n=1 Tax=Bat associated circovirus 6 TaxID=2003311 RepID=A0A0D3MDS5_9CIRC|nr:Rep [Bat associated circovirus 6]AIF76262.1 Rep [Bat associated circovirus 6]